MTIKIISYGIVWPKISNLCRPMILFMVCLPPLALTLSRRNLYG